MPPDNPNDKARHYSEKEVSRLLEYATDLQEKDEAERHPAPESVGTTLVALQEAAAEVGIEPRFIQLAAARIDSPEAAGMGAALAGTPLVIRAEQVIPGDLPEEDYERLVEEVQSATEEHGNWTIVGRTLTWWDSATSLEVTVVSRSGDTRIQAKRRLHGWAGILFGLGVGGVGIGIGTVGLAFGMKMLGSALFAALFPIGLTGSLYVAMRRVMKSMGRDRRVQLERLVDRIVQFVQRTPR